MPGISWREDSGEVRYVLVSLEVHDDVGVLIQIIVRKVLGSMKVKDPNAVNKATAR
jgi:hypothetical protein